MATTLPVLFVLLKMRLLFKNREMTNLKISTELRNEDRVAAVFSQSVFGKKETRNKRGHFSTLNDGKDCRGAMVQFFFFSAKIFNNVNSTMSANFVVCS